MDRDEVVVMQIPEHYIEGCMAIPDKDERCNLGKSDIGTTRFDGR